VQRPIGDNRELIYSPVNFARAVVTKQESLILAACSSFEELENHTQRLLKQFYLKPDQLKERLDALVAQGLLISESDLIESICKTPNSDHPPRKISSLGIPTRNRPAKLGEGLRSFVQQAREHGRQMRFVVADGSDTDEMQQANVAVLSSL